MITISTAVERNAPSGPDAATVASASHPRASKSLQLIRACRLQSDDPIIVIAAGTPLLVEALLAAGYSDLTVVHRSSEELDALHRQINGFAHRPTLLSAEVTEFHPRRRYALWHDSDVFPLLTYPEERQRYLEVLQEALRPGGYAVIATPGPAGALQWRGLPVRRYSALTLPAEFGQQFELTEHSLETERTPSGEHQEHLYCRFRRRAPT